MPPLAQRHPPHPAPSPAPNTNPYTQHLLVRCEVLVLALPFVSSLDPFASAWLDALPELVLWPNALAPYAVFNRGSTAMARLTSMAIRATSCFLSTLDLKYVCCTAL